MLKLIKLVWLLICKFDLVIRIYYIKEKVFKKIFLIYFGLGLCNMLYMFTLEDEFSLFLFTLNFLSTLFFIRYGWLDW